MALPDADRVVPRDRELEWLVKEMAGHPAVWSHLIRYAEPRLCMPIVGVPGVQTWLLTWGPGQGSGLHDHRGSAWAFVVMRGSLREDVVDEAGQVHARSRAVGDVSSFRSNVVHELRNEGTEGAVSLHAFRPELAGLTPYVLEGGRVVPSVSG